jgi:TFIIH basal transcription factor complex TTD-A subunit
LLETDRRRLRSLDIRIHATLPVYHFANTTYMPRAIKGALLQCDPPQMAMVRKIDKENNNAYIIEEIDDETCLVKENKVEEIKAKVKALMDDAMKPTGAMEIDSEKDSDMD